MDLSSLRVGSSRQLLGGARKLLSSVAINGVSAGSANGFTRSDLNNAAVSRLTLSRSTSDSTEESAPVEGAAAAPQAPQSGLGSWLSEIRSVSESLREIRARSAENPELFIGDARYLDELKRLEAEFSRLTQSAQISRLGEILSGVNRGLQSGASGEVIARALQPESALLGNDLLQQIRSRSTSSLSSILSGVATITNLGAANDTSRDAVDAALSAIRSISGALSTPATSPSLAPESISDETEFTPPPPKLADMSFQNASELSVGLRGYIGSDIVQAALAQQPYDAKKALILLSPEGEIERRNRRTKIQTERGALDDRIDASTRVTTDEGNVA